MTDIEKVQVSQNLKTSAVLFIMLAVITGVIYPLAVSMTGQILLPWQAHGSLFYDTEGNVSGSQLIGQPFSGEKYFWPRPSATSEHPYNALASSGSNLGPTNKKLLGDILNETEEMKKANNADNIPSDLVMSSASGLDPHISIESAKLQAARIAKARSIDVEAVNRVIDENSEKPLLGILGKERVNIVLLNKELDRMKNYG